MRRILQWACLLSGATLLLLMAGMGLARRASDGPLYWAIVKGWGTDGGSFENVLYLLEPASGFLKPLTPAYNNFHWVGQADGWIYYAGSLTNAGLPSIYRVQLGSQPMLVVPAAGMYQPATLAPNRQWLVYHLTLESRFELYSVPLGGGPTVHLTADLAAAGNRLPSTNSYFSPDGAWLSFEAVDEKGQVDVFAVRLDGTGFQNLTGTWQGEAHLMTAQVRGGVLVKWYDELYLVNPVTLEQRQLVAGATHSEYAAWAVPDVLFYFDATNTLRALRVPDDVELWSEQHVVNWWLAPRGRWVLFYLFLPDAPSGWVLRSGDGNTRQTLTEPFAVPPYAINGAWSHDETRAAVIPLEPVAGAYEIWGMTAGTWRRIGKTPNFVARLHWSPDNSHLLLLEQNGDSRQLAWVRVADGQRHVINSPLQPLEFEGWGPKIDKTWSAAQIGVIGGLLLLIGLRLGRKGKKLMRRILQWACLLGGVTLMLVTAGIGLARRAADGPLHWAIVTGQTPNGAFENALYLLEPHSGHMQKLTPTFYYIRMVGQVGDSIYYAAGTTDDGLPTVYRVQPGQSPQVIVSEAGLPNQSALSSDGKWIIFYRGVENTYEFYSVPAAGGPIYPLTAGLSANGGYLLSPIAQLTADGQWLAFEALDQNQRLDIYAVRLDGTGLRNLTATWQVGPRLVVVESSPDILVQSLPGDTLVQIDPTSGVARPITGVMPTTLYTIAGAADLVFYRDRSNLLRGARVSDGSLLWEERDVYASWISLQGQWILLYQFPVDAPAGWVLRRGDGSARQTLTPPFPVAPNELIVAWAYAETRAAMMTANPVAGTYDFWILEAALGTWRRIGQAPDFIFNFYWSPDDTHLLLHESVANGSQLTWLRIADGQRQTIHPPDHMVIQDFVGWGAKIDKSWSAVRLGLFGGALLGIGFLAGRRSKNS